jgi:hypothetical protein
LYCISPPVSPIIDFLYPLPHIQQQRRHILHLTGITSTIVSIYIKQQTYRR